MINEIYNIQWYPPVRLKSRGDIRVWTESLSSDLVLQTLNKGHETVLRLEDCPAGENLHRVQQVPEVSLPRNF